ncbi:TatD DNase domain containing, partial [Perkinsus olseni]
FQNECNVNSDIAVPPPPETQIFWDAHCHLDWIMLKSHMGRAINRNKIAVRMDLQLPLLDTFASDNFGESFGGCVIAGFGLSTVHSTVEILEFSQTANFLKDKVFGVVIVSPGEPLTWSSVGSSILCVGSPYIVMLLACAAD